MKVPSNIQGQIQEAAEAALLPLRPVRRAKAQIKRKAESLCLVEQALPEQTSDTVKELSAQIESLHKQISELQQQRGSSHRSRPDPNIRKRHFTRNLSGTRAPTPNCLQCGIARDRHLWYCDRKSGRPAGGLCRTCKKQKVTEYRLTAKPETVPDAGPIAL